MIKLTRPEIPSVLIENQQVWTARLINAVKEYGGYKEIPSEIKDEILKPYRHPDIQTTLFSSSHQKCCFCESIPAESGYIEVEHFAPKNKYFNRAFFWKNLLPACKRCNVVKSVHDSIENPIVNPYEDDPSDYFEFDSIQMIPAKTSPSAEKALKTIEVCGLNSPRTYKPRADLLVQLYTYKQVLHEKIVELKAASYEKTRQKRIQALSDSIDLINALCLDSQSYSGFVRYFLSRCQEYQDALSILESHFVSPSN